VPVIDHIDLAVSDVQRSLAFYRGLLKPLGWIGKVEQTGERGEAIHYLWGPNQRATLGLRQAQSPTDAAPDRYAVGIHHLAFHARTRRRVDERARWLREQGVVIESGPKRHDYTPGYYAVFFYDPDGLKLEIVVRPRWRVLFRRP
jgi:catechol 2,3-dioxygenase-like lactoylglutathione lyase family enzyme